MNKTYLTSLILTGASLTGISQDTEKSCLAGRQANVLIILTDQWRAQAFGYAGDPNVITPNIDRLASESINFKNAVSVAPVCSPARASLLTGQFPLTHGVFINDARLSPEAITIGETFKNAGYSTGYIGKWHVDGHGRQDPIPVERRHGFDYWKVLECTHDYNNSNYFDENNEKHTWEGYDAFSQTDSAIAFMAKQNEKPFLMVLSLGPPHSPYLTAPEKYQDMYDADKLIMPQNIPDYKIIDTRPNLKGYYAHCTAVDDCVGEILTALSELKIDSNTIILFTSDHGEMIGTKGFYDKQVPFDESIRIPMLLKIPHAKSQVKEYPANIPDFFPTLAALCKIDIPNTVEGYDLTEYIQNDKAPSDAAYIQLVHPFGKWDRGIGGKEYRAIRTERYTYVENLDGPWLLYDNIEDPYQEKNLTNLTEYKEIQSSLKAILQEEMLKRKDEFKSSKFYTNKWGYEIDCGGKITEFNNDK